ALARRAARILSRDPPHAFLPAISWRRPGWALAAGAVTLGAVLWLGQGTAITPWLPGAHAGHVVGTGAPQATVAGTEAAVGGTQGGGGSANLAHAEDAGVRGGAGAAGDVPGTGAPQATVAGTEAAVGGTQGEGGSATVTHAEDAGVRRGAGAAGDSHTGPAPGDHAAGGTRRGDPPGGSGSGVGGAAGESARPRAHPAGPPLPERNPSEAAPENVLDTMRCQKPLIGEEGRPPDEGESPRKFLGQMGVSTADERRYTTAWPSGRQGPYAGPDATPPAGRVRTVPGKADGEVLEPTGNGAARAVVVPHDAGAGERGALIHAAEVRVSPRLRSAVRAYFERIGQLARPDAPSRKDGSP
ncbi:MAG: hypothetical protein U9R68_10695, partial [Planctomycetota bacterium]|nr:hypothetical protein [Planctomycetota bacterium]